MNGIYLAQQLTDWLFVGVTLLLSGLTNAPLKKSGYKSPVWNRIISRAAGPVAKVLEKGMR
jgi:hypothetical protein